MVLRAHTEFYNPLAELMGGSICAVTTPLD